MKGYTKPILSKSTFDWNCLKVSPLVVVGQMPKSSLSEANMGGMRADPKRMDTTIPNKNRKV
jgi:hypothetical protein